MLHGNENKFLACMELKYIVSNTGCEASSKIILLSLVAQLAYLLRPRAVLQ